MNPGEEWASLEEHSRLWISRGRENPDPTHFTEDALTLEGVKLYDLLPFGSDGACGYYHLYLGPEPAPFRFGLISSLDTIESARTFSDALLRILEFHLGEREDEGVE